MKTSQLLARCFATIVQRFSSPPVGWKTSQAQQLPLLEDSGNQSLSRICCHFDSSSLPLTAILADHSETEGLLPGSVKCSDFLKLSRGWLQWETPREGPDPIVLGQVLRSGLFRLTCCLTSFSSLPIQDAQAGFPNDLRDIHHLFTLFLCLTTERSLEGCQNKV